MASRPVWKGQLRLSLVSIPVEIHSARNRGATVSFRQIHGPSCKPVHYQKVANSVGPVDSGEILKGYDTGDGDYNFHTLLRLPAGIWYSPGVKANGEHRRLAGPGRAFGQDRRKPRSRAGTVPKRQSRIGRRSGLSGHGPSNRPLSH